jgi:hypothetical protein
MSADDRLADGRRIADVLAEDERERERERAAAAEREEAQFDTYLSFAFGIELSPPRPTEEPPPEGNRDPDHGAAPRGAPRDDPDVERYIRERFPSV